MRGCMAWTLRVTRDTCQEGFLSFACGLVPALVPKSENFPARKSEKAKRKKKKKQKKKKKLGGRGKIRVKSEEENPKPTARKTNTERAPKTRASFRKSKAKKLACECGKANRMPFGRKGREREKREGKTGRQLLGVFTGVGTPKNRGR